MFLMKLYRFWAQDNFPSKIKSAIKSDTDFTNNKVLAFQIKDTMKISYSKD